MFGLLVVVYCHRSANRGDSSDRLIDDEEREMQDFLILVILTSFSLTSP